MSSIENIPAKTEVRYLPCYNISEASAYLKLPRTTLRAWFGGQANLQPLITPAQDKPLTLSFINLVEAYVLASVRRECKLSANKIRRGLNFISRNCSSEHPLAEKGFETDGLPLLLEKSGVTCDISSGNHSQAVSREILGKYMHRIKRESNGLPAQFYPFSRNGKMDDPKPVLIDPRISFGRPVLSIVNIPVEIVIERYKAGETVSELVGDYECNREKIEDAIRCQLWEQAA